MMIEKPKSNFYFVKIFFRISYARATEGTQWILVKFNQIDNHPQFSYLKWTLRGERNRGKHHNEDFQSLYSNHQGQEGQNLTTLITNVAFLFIFLLF